MAGWDWLQGFLKRHPKISIRKPEATSAARARGFNKVSVSKFFTLLTEVMEAHKFTPQNIYNVDESGFSCVPGQMAKILARTGKKQVGTITAAERGQTVTVEICMSVNGNFIPPLFIFPRARKAPELMTHAPPGSIDACQPKGWINCQLFSLWFDHFVKCSGASQQNKILLILGGHSSYTKNIDVIDKARGAGVILLCIPPHCSHRLQRLDVSFMKPLSTYFNATLRSFHHSHPGVIPTYARSHNYLASLPKGSNCLHCC